MCDIIIKCSQSIILFRLFHCFYNNKKIALISNIWERTIFMIIILFVRFLITVLRLLLYVIRFALIPKILSACLKYREDKEGELCCFSVSPEEVKFLVTTLAVSVCATARLRAGVCSTSARVHVPTLVRCTRRPACTDAVHTATTLTQVGRPPINSWSQRELAAGGAELFSIAERNSIAIPVCDDYHRKR